MYSCSYLRLQGIIHILYNVSPHNVIQIHAALVPVIAIDTTQVSAQGVRQMGAYVEHRDGAGVLLKPTLAIDSKTAPS